MKKLIQIFAVLFCFLTFAQDDYVLSPSSAVATDVIEPEADQERIISFNSNISIAENADVTVTEIIKVFANGGAIKRGIFRALPTVRNINGGKIDIDYKIIAVEREGAKEPHHSKKENGVFTIYIGDKDYQLSSGIYTYKIVYKTQDQIGKFKGYDEFYWNVNGTDWDFPVENIQATIHLPKNADILQNSCYTGLHGSKDKNCTSNKISSTEIVFKANDLKENENLTVAVGFKNGVLKEPSSFFKWMRRNLESLPLFLVGIYLLFFYYRNWKKHGVDPEKPVVIPQFNAPGNLSPASLGYIDNGVFDANLVTASLVDLSIKGLVDIDEVKDSKETFLSRIFILKKLKIGSHDLQSDQKLLLKQIFGEQDTISVDGKYNSNLKDAIEDFEEEIVTENKIYVQNNSNIKLVYKALKIIVVSFFLALIIHSFFYRSFEVLGMTAVMSVFAGLFAAILVVIWEDRNKVVFYVVLFFACAVIIPFFVMAFSESSELSSFQSNCYKFLIFSIASLFVFRYFIKSPSREKLKMESEIAGFKMYLSAAEENQLKFHNPPEMTTDVYEKFLPYAIVFGVEGIWGKRFRNKLQDSIDSQPLEIKNQFDYSFADSFTSTLKGSTVSPVSSFSSSSSSSSSSSGSSSYSGGSDSSGSSGGGSSGGGGGGGGGGGW
ncbi:DUF2207 domain-containing protein [Chryseobacterium wangxinyae]|uniref:DUF2207 domain-containing protein n=1 Tax=Chryseobacterium sp. CY350 TaxID=2997336 RepID=UPI002271FE3A|nr:DUF2207 domain-containing protein [Chryseobacterium sp. CY350]MCY0979035.1 DUF2207 domain-containing protein [Chryseobacterium sp. CY350]WBZ97238.1 DUF2207 domain-containing protein [Chryseobacterium sp. CY350]